MEADLKEEVIVEADEDDPEVVGSELVRTHTRLHALGRDYGKFAKCCKRGVLTFRVGVSVPNKCMTGWLSIHVSLLHCHSPTRLTIIFLYPKTFVDFIKKFVIEGFVELFCS